MKGLHFAKNLLAVTSVLIIQGLQCTVLTQPSQARESVWWRGVNLAGAEFGNNIPGVYNSDYIYPNQDEVDYYKSKAMFIIRLPFRWERLQPDMNGDFNTDEFNRLKTFVNKTTANGVKVIIDPHNYARYYGQLIGSASVPNSGFANLWQRLAIEFKSNQNVIFGLMNEPRNMPTEQWVDAANAAIKMIRDEGASNLILVPGNRWTGAWSWFTIDDDGPSNAEAMLKIQDPYKSYMIEVHQYLDQDSSGTTENCVSSTIGSERLRDFTQWLREHELKGFLGEFSAGPDQQCSTALANMVQYVEDNADVWRGWTYWAGGPLWGKNNSIEPDPVNRQDKPQMDVLEQFLPIP